MAGEIFGSANGTSAALADQLRMQQTQGEALKNQSMAMQLQEQQKLQQLMQQEQTRGGPPRSPVEQMEDMASLSMKSGLISSGADLAGKAAAIRLKQAQSTHAEAQTVEQQALAAKTELDTVDRLLGGVTDQQSWDAANSLFKQMTGRDSPFAGMAYNPVLVGQLQQSTLTLKDKLDLGIKDYRAKTERANSDNQQDFRQFRKDYLTGQQDLAKQREQRLSKQGGKSADIGVPQKAELDGAATAIQSAYPNLPTDEVNQAAYAIASRARALRKTTPGLDAQQAMDRAMIEAKAQGQFQTVQDTYKIFGHDTGVNKGGPHSTYKHEGAGNGDGSTPGTAIASIPAAPQRKEGAYYKAPNGATYRWTKDGWEAANAAQ